MAKSSSLGDEGNTVPLRETIMSSGIASQLPSGGPEGSQSDTSLTASSDFNQSSQQELPQAIQQLSEAERVKQQLSEAQREVTAQKEEVQKLEQQLFEAELEIKALNGELWTERTLLKQLKVAVERRAKQRREAVAELRGALRELFGNIAGTTRVRSRE